MLVAWNIRTLKIAPISKKKKKKLKIGELLRQAIQGPVELILIDPVNSFPVNRKYRIKMSRGFPNEVLNSCFECRGPSKKNYSH